MQQLGFDDSTVNSAVSTHMHLSQTHLPRIRGKSNHRNFKLPPGSKREDLTLRIERCLKRNGDAASSSPISSWIYPPLPDSEEMADLCSNSDFNFLLLCSSISNHPGVPALSGRWQKSYMDQRRDKMVYLHYHIMPVPMETQSHGKQKCLVVCCVSKPGEETQTDPYIRSRPS